MNLMNCLDLTQQIVQQIFRSKYKSKVDANFNIECNQIRKKWSANSENHLTIQFYLKKQVKSYLVEEWNVISAQQQITDDAQLQLQKCCKLASSTPLCNRPDNMIDHIIYLNEKKRADWIDPKSIITDQVIISHKLTINVAFLKSLEIIDKQEQETINEFQSFRRDRFLSDDIKQNYHLRKTSDVDGQRQYRKNKAIISKAMNRMNDSCSSNSSRNKSFQLLTIINKKDDVEILSSAEDAQKIIDEDENGDYEIQMIIDDQPIDKGQTVIIKSQSQQHPVINLISKIRNKEHQFSSQLPETLSFIKDYYY